MTRQLGEDWAIRGANFKFINAGYPIHAAVEAAMTLAAEHAIDAASIESVHVGMPENAMRVVDGRRHAQHLPAGHVERCPGPGRLSLRQSPFPAVLSDPAFARLRARVTLGVDPGLNRDQPNGRGSNVTIITANGLSVSRRVDYPRGHSRRGGVAWSDLSGKWHDLLPEYDVDRMLALAQRLEDIDDVNELSGAFKAGTHRATDMRSFQHITPPLRLFHGPDSLEQLGRELDRVKSRRAVIFCGSSLARAGSPLDLVRSAMGDRCAGIFTGVRAHSPVPDVQAAAQELKRLEADAVVAVGGGSAIVTARAASILAAENGDPGSLCTSQDESGKLKSPKLLAPKLPQLIIPTTPTTAMVKAGSAVFDPVTGERLALFDPKTRAQSIFIHPDLASSAPRELAVSASLDTFALAIEGLTSRSGDPISDALLMHALRLLALRLRSLHDDAQLRGELMLAAVLCGQGTDHTGAGIATVLGHAIGARYEADNGVIKAIVLPSALRFNADASKPGLQKVATSLGLHGSASEPPVGTVVNAVETMFSELGIPRRLRDVGRSSRRVVRHSRERRWVTGSCAAILARCGRRRNWRRFWKRPGSVPGETPVSLRT